MEQTLQAAHRRVGEDAEHATAGNLEVDWRTILSNQATHWCILQASPMICLVTRGWAVAGSCIGTDITSLHVGA